MTDYSSYPTLLQSSQSEYVSSEAMDSTNNQMSNNNIIYNSAPLIVLNSHKSDMALLQNSMINDGQAYVTIQAQPNSSATDLNGTKLINTPIIIQGSQYQQQQHQSSTMNIQQNNNGTQMTSLTPSQLQSLSYLMQTQIAPQFIQTANGLIQIIPQSFFTTQQQQQQGQSNQGHDHQIQTQITGLPTLGWSIGNFNTGNNSINQDNQLQSLQLNNISLPQLIPVQQVIPSNNSFFTNQNDDQHQIVNTIVDLNVIDKKGPIRKTTSRRKRKPATKVTNNNYSSQLSSPLTHPTSTNEVTKEAAESSCGGGIVVDGITQYDNKGRPFSFLCPDCPKKFTLNSRLSAHMRCHTGMRPFTCVVCGFSFTQKSYLIRHAAVHKEERPFHCEKCQKSYKHYGSLANHRKLHRKDEKTDCDQTGDNLKLEPTVSDNGRSSSISSLVINNCNEFSSSLNQNNSSYQEVTNSMMVCLKDEQLQGDNNNNSFTITSTTTATTTVSGDNDDDSYIKQLGMIYPVSLSSDNDNQIKSLSSNIFFQEQLVPNDEIDGNYGEENNGMVNMAEQEEEVLGDEDEEEYGEDEDGVEGMGDYPMAEVSVSDSRGIFQNSVHIDYPQ